MTRNNTHTTRCNTWCGAHRTALFAALLAVLLTAIPAAASGETAPATLTVDEAVGAALRNSLSVKESAITESAKKRESDLAFNRFYPTVSLSGTLMELNSVNPSLVAVAGGTNIYYTPDKTNLALGVTVQEVFTPAFMVLMNQAVIYYQDQTINRQQAERNLTAAVKKMYYQLVIQKETIDITRSRLDKARERQRQADVSFQLGQTSELNYSYATANVEDLIPQLRNMETARAAALAAFQRLIGYDGRPDTELTDTETQDGIRGDRWDGREEDRLDVRRSAMAVKRTKGDVNIQNIQLLPSFILQYKADPTLNNPGTNDPFKKDNWHQSSGGLSATIAWDLSPLIPGSNFQVKRKEIRERAELAEASAVDTMRKAIDDADTQKRAIEASQANLANLERALQASRRAYELTDISYRAGAGKLLDLQDAELATQQAEFKLLSEKLTLMSLVFDWDAKYATTPAM